MLRAIVQVCKVGPVLVGAGLSLCACERLASTGHAAVAALGGEVGSGEAVLPQTQGPCAGMRVDRDPHPQPDLPRPAKGVPYTDPQFGSRVIRITDVKAENAGKAGARIPLYSTIPAWNADESLLILYQTAGFVANSGLPSQHLLYDGRTYQFKKVLNITPGDVEHIYWHPSDPDVFFFPENVQQSDGSNLGRLIKYHVSTDVKEVLKTFTRDDIVGVGGYPGSNGLLDFSHPKYMAWDGSKLGLRWRYGGLRSNGTQANYDGMTATYNLNSNIVSRWVYIPGTQLSSPDRVGVDVAPSGTIAVRGPQVLNPLSMTPHVRPDGSSRLHVGWDGHATLVPTGNGQDLLVGPQYDVPPVGVLVTENLQTGEVKTIMGKANGWGYPPSAVHVSGLALKNLGWVAVSIVGGAPGDGVMSAGKKLLEQEIVLANVNTGVICRVAHHHSARTSQGYWAEPHVVISPSGTRMLFGSDWRNSDSIDSYVIELPSYRR